MSATSTKVEVPDIGDFDDVPVIEVLVSVGDTVAVEDPLVTLESDKATMDVPAPFAGMVKDISVSVGDRVSQGSVLMSIEGSDESGDSGGAESAEAGAALDRASEQTVAPAEAVEAPSPAGPGVRAGPAPVGRGAEPPGGGVPRPPGPHQWRRTDLRQPVGAPARARTGVGPAVGDRQRAQGAHHQGGRAEPGRRQGCRARARRRRRLAPVAASPGLDLLPWPTVDFEKYGPVERVERSRIQRISAPNLARNWVMIPHVTHNDEADITELEAWRKQLNEEYARAGVKFTMVSFLVAACVVALKEFPAFNSSLDGDDLVLKRYYNVGFAADTPGGLLVPVIKDADRKGIKEIAGELTDLSGRAREGKLSLDEMRGATFTISSLGGIGGTSFTPIINAPEVAILGVTRAAMKPVWNGSEFVPRLMVPLSLSYDHRVIDGAGAARFVSFLVGVLSDLRRALL